jgi:predicted secreted protein
MNTRLMLSLVVIVVLLTSVGGATAHSGANAPAAPQAAVGSGFTFQGQLKNAGATVNGSCAMTFRLYDAAAAGAQIGSTITATVPVSNSLFTVMLNANGEYGANAFNGDARWLQVAVKCTGDSTFTTLTPRQQITAAPAHTAI